MKILYPTATQRDKFLLENPGQSGTEFLLSSNWENILMAEKASVLSLAVEGEKEELLALVLLEQKKIKSNFFYWYAPRGPLFKINLEEKDRKNILDFLISEIKKINVKAIFLKIEPAQAIQIKEQFIPVNPVQPKKTLILDLHKSQDELLKEMHQKTRYNIRLAEKKGVVITEGTSDDFVEFWRLMKLTGSRDSFRIHDKVHYEILTKQSNFVKLYFAEFENKKIAAALVSYFGNKATYLHGASDNEYRNIMAPYLLQWEIIKKTQSSNFEIYDLYGIDEIKWPGVTRFKVGFGGEEKMYPGVFDIPFTKIGYKIYSTLKKLRALF